MSDVAPLVSADWLADRLGDRSLLLIDIRSAVDGGGAAAYAQAHVPGAVHTDYARDGWRATKGMATGLLPDLAFLADLFGRLGLTPQCHAVIISAGTSPGDFCAAARVYWTLKVAGHDKVSILDGGMLAWGDRPARAGVEAATPAPAYPVRYRDELRADLAAVERAVRQGGDVLLDSRSASYFAGNEKSPQAKRAGRLPAARLIDHTRVFDATTKRLRPRAELEALFGDMPPLPVVNYCNTGHQAAANWFVLSEVLGRPAKLYDGSMSEWTEDERRPVEVG
ncbi:MAG TPA: rhodanese-like domain-containing protein [Xanthobacteraceae bacterium]|nr:rhodanese-like domain-containing protein [Xanthobacteraceae bacterium]